MKKILLSVLILGLIVSACSAENLMTALPIGKDNIAIQGFYSSMNIKVADSSLTEFGPRVIYGLTDDLDLIGKVAIGSIAGLSATTLGAGAKYNFTKVASGDPFDLAGVVNFDSTSGKDYTMGTMGFGVEISKYLKNNFSLYGLLNILQISAKYTGTPSSSASALQCGGGVKYFINKKISLFGELSMFVADNESYSVFSFAMQYML